MSNKVSNGVELIPYDGEDIVPFYHNKLQGFYQIYTSDEVKLSVIILMIKSLIWYIYTNADMPKFDPHLLLNDLEPTETSTLICSIKADFNKIDPVLLTKLISECNPYLFSMDLCKTPVAIFMNTEYKILFDIFSNIHIKNRSDVIELQNNIKDFGYKQEYMDELYAKTA